uniref:E3 ubiquitin-protein ligase RNF26 n=1 Tax=Tetraodon nigroviridis TaxID=99883 RepID=H3CQS4_TETNG
MGLLNLVISTVSKCLDVVCLLLDLNFLVVHTVMRTVVGVITFITSLPTLLLTSLAELGNCVVFGVISLAEASSNVAQGTVTMLGSIVLALEGLLESLKMMGYLTMHVLLRGKEQLCRGLVSLLEGCGIALSLVVYFTNTVVNFVLIATQNVYVAVVSVLQTLSCPLQKALELALTCLTCVSSSLAGTSAFLWSPCKVVLDFLISLVHMFMSIFILNVYGLLLTVTIALTTTAYLNPELSRHAATRVLGYVNSHAAVRRLFAALRAFASAASYFLRAAVRHLPRMLHHTQQPARSGAEGAAPPGPPSARRRRPGGPEAGPPRWKGGRAAPPGGALVEQDRTAGGADPDSLLKEQEDRKKCVICQDANKTVVLLPCRHLCLCRGCTSILLRQPLYQHNCPLCRRMILDTMDVYL